MSQYLLSVHNPVDGGPTLSEEEMVKMHDAVMAFHDQLRDQGAFVFGGGLYTVDTASVVTQQDSEVVTTEGPFADNDHQLGGFWIVEAPDLAAAQALAAAGSAARNGARIEVRRFHDLT